MGKEGPALPGRLVESAKCEQRIMIGELASGEMPDHIVVVNLSLETSIMVKLELNGARQLEMYSPTDGSLAPTEREFWLTAGQGMLFRLESR
jgi:hypothetical protein